MKLYLDEKFNEKIENEILLYKTIKELRIDLNDLFHRNFRKLKKDMKLEENLSKNIEECLKNSLEIIDNIPFKNQNKKMKL